MLNKILERAIKGEFVLIAEIGVNYYDVAAKLGIPLMDAAKEMIREAKDAGIHAVKFQSYKAETLAAKESPSYWDTSEEKIDSQYKLFKKFDSFSYEEYKELSAFCEEIGIEFLSTAFDIESANYLDELMNIYKISSSDLNNHPFVEHQAKKGKPILLSVGASNADEIDKTLEVIRKHNNQPLILLHCVLEYPTPYEHANLNKIVSLKERYPDVIMGYSDHTKPDSQGDVIKTAYTLGALVIEKHFTLDKSIPGNDHYHAMDPIDARNIIAGVDFVDRIRGGYEIKCLDTEAKARNNARRSLVSASAIKKGDVITHEFLTFKRPGTGIPPNEIEGVIGKRAALDIEEDTVLQFEMLE
ncbi:N-acetylneuraminate synthase family protein [Planococcus sp. APC 3906]|uniref:N-acetylneuraminate synthase family protein n=1 Tax=Planococcus sp. APC 3906 TaxID=3035194 RepID=UPI0025B48C50|nr:N-acetylneuraminate synthase family protein [Planococcus sp. APC 3906]MDN3450105.1 N-acetylneuraminate synthase family protein [Planococcus sp. APC 3906]